MSRRNAFLLLSGVTLMLLSPLYAGTLCVKHESGMLAVRDTCKPNETPIDPASVGLQSAGLKVKDRNGVFVGFLVDLVVETVARGVQGETVLLSLTAAGFRDSGLLYVAYGSADCTGDPFLYPDPNDGGTLTKRARIPPGVTTAYFPKPPFGVSTIRSTLQYSSVNDPEVCIFDGGTFVPPYGCCRAQAAFDQLVWSAGRVEIGEFVPPFHVEAP